MIEKLKEICFYLVMGYALVSVSKILESKFIFKFLSEDLIILLVALMAINTTTGSVVISKLKEINDKADADFSQTMIELRLSVIEQVWYIVIALIASILFASPVISKILYWPELIFGGVLAAIFIASLHNLYDTAHSIFLILQYEHGKSPN